jgi:hypothetical protein
MKLTALLLAVCFAASANAADIVLYSTTAPSGGTTVVTNNVGGLTSGLRVRYIDYDGTILSTQFVTNGATATPPDNPTRDLLTFAEWNINATNITQDTDIGATYSTTDGKTYAFLRVTTVTTTNCTLYLNKSDTSTVSIAWGDGVTTTHTNSGNFNTGAHAYPSNGNYVVTIWRSAGAGTYGLGNGSATTTFVGGNTQVNRDMLADCFIGSNVVDVSASAFNNSYSLYSIMIPFGVTTIGISAFSTCSSLTHVTIPSGVNSVAATTFNTCSSLKTVAIPSGVTNIGASAFISCVSLNSVTIPSGVSSIGASAFSTCTALSHAKIPSIITIEASTFSTCRSLSSVVIPNSVVNMLGSAFVSCQAIYSITIPSGVTNIGFSAFNGCTTARYFNFLPTNPPVIPNVFVFDGIKSSTKIYVPDAYLTNYQTAAVWSNSPIPVLYLYPVSQKP